MDGQIEYSQWMNYFNGFNKRNRWRPTRLEVVGQNGAEEVERGLPLVGISLEQDSIGAPRIHIMLGDHEAEDPRHLTCTITSVKRVTPRCGTDGQDQALEIEDELGERNLLLFEPRPLVSEIR